MYFLNYLMEISIDGSKITVNCILVRSYLKSKIINYRFSKLNKACRLVYHCLYKIACKLQKITITSFCKFRFFENCIKIFTIYHFHTN